MMKFLIAFVCLAILVGCSDESAGRTSEKKEMPTTANDYDPQTGMTGDDVAKLKGESK